MRRQRGRVGLVAAALVGLAVSGAQAQVTTERSASILVFPKVIADGNTTLDSTWRSFAPIR